MTTLEKVIERLRALPKEAQEEKAREIEQLLDETDDFTPEQRAELARRECGTDEGLFSRGTKNENHLA